MNQQQQQQQQEEEDSHNMEAAATFNSHHSQLLEWQDTLEFLCFTLYYIIKEDRRWPCYQAAELCDCIKELIKACSDKGGKLYPLIQGEDGCRLKQKLRQIRKIRHAVAHRVPQTENDMCRKQEATNWTIAELEKLIGAAAARYDIRSMEMYPPATCGAMTNSFQERNSQTVTVQLNGPPVLSARREALERFTAEAAVSRAPDRRRSQLELYEIAYEKRLGKRKQHFQDMLATRDRQLERIKQAKKYEELALRQLNDVPSQGYNRLPLVLITANLAFAASLMFYF
ncbi:hypothetical protein ACJ72_07996 [Emergomyces africanus]|uniref:Uncharacterized protein n=1 Tax=Emergomyces africanus TaxID=1955775 RepID=A0A1B7NLI9_9EURO|nr:hypothetical protein ACJ72_07996 [Emergomyces africanus]